MSMLNTALHPRKLAAITRPLSPADEAILAALNRYHYLSAVQVLRLLYSKGSLTYVQTRLKGLADARLCERLWLPRVAAHGSAPSVYRLASRGLKHLLTQGAEVPGRHRPSDHSAHSHHFLSHALALNDFLIGAELFARGRENVQLAGMLHDQVLKRRPTYVDASGRRMAVIPDAWLDFHLEGSYQVCLSVELDMGTEEQRHWRNKVRGLAAFARGPYEQAFGTKSLTIAVVSAVGEKRMRALLSWTEAELDALGEKRLANLFLFTDSHQTEPDEQFLAPRWYQPYAAHGVALLQGTT